MSRFYNDLNEKVNKKEIDAILGSDDILVGAEFEFKMNESFLDNYRSAEKEDYENAIENSINYDDALYDFDRSWRNERSRFVSDFLEETFPDRDHSDLTDEEDGIVEEATEKWEDEHPAPEEPDQPNDYISSWNRNEFENDFDHMRNSLQDYLDANPQILESSRGWDINEDCSLGGGYGIELVSPPMSLPKFLKICPNVFDMIKKIGDTDNDCGLHINISLKNGMDKIDTVKLCLFVDEDYLWKFFDGREANMYVISMKEKIRQEMYSDSTKQFGSEGVTRVHQLRNMIRTKDLDIKYSSQHYHGINIEHMDEESPYIEFRYIGGSGYHLKWDKIKVVIAQYVYALKISRDPNYKKKEYIAKCSRILSKLEVYLIMQEIDKVKSKTDPILYEPKRSYRSDKKESLYSNKVNAQYLKKLERRLQFLPKLSKKEEEFMRMLNIKP